MTKCPGDIRVLGVQGDRDVGGERPRGRRPDHHARFPGEAAREDGKFDVNRGVAPFLVFHFGLGEGGLRAGAPEDGFLALVNEVEFHEPREAAELPGLVRGVECEVRAGPVAEDSEALELGALDVDIFARVRLRLPAHFERGKARGFLHHAIFDREAVAIPPRNERRAEPGHGARFHDDVLEDFVEGGAHVDIAVRKGRSVVQHEEGRIAARGLDLPVEVFALPAFQQLGLPLHEVRLHGERGAREVQGVFVIHCVGARPRRGLAI